MKTTTHVVEVDGLKRIDMVTEPSLIRVLAIKAKFLEQMPRLKMMTNSLPEHNVVGLAFGYEVLVEVNHVLHKIHRTDYAEYLSGGNTIDNTRKAYDTIDCFPQIFAD